MSGFKHGLVWHPKKLKRYTQRLIRLWKKRTHALAFEPGELKALVTFIVTKLLGSERFIANEIDFVFDVIVIEYFLRRVEEPDEDTLDWDTSYDNWDGFRCGLTALKKEASLNQRGAKLVSMPFGYVWKCWHECAYSRAH